MATSQSSVWTWRVESLGERADRALLVALEAGLGTWEGPVVESSRSFMQRLIEEGHVTVGGEKIKSNTKFNAGALVRVEFPPPEPTELEPWDQAIDIIFQDEHLIVLNKPPELTVHPSTTQKTETLVHALLHHVKDLSGIGGKLRPGIVHRIDKDTSGAIVITKTDQAHRALVETFAKHDIERKYWALAYGSPALDEQRVETLIARHLKDRKKMSTEVKTGRKAVSLVKRIESYGIAKKSPFASFLEVQLETGRTHQVRVHLAHLGHSILGDPVYGTPTTLRHTKWLALPKSVQTAVTALPGQALHARVLGFKHPITGEALRFEAEPPEAFRLLMAELKQYL